MALYARNTCSSLRTWWEQCLHDESLNLTQSPHRPTQFTYLHIFYDENSESWSRVIVIEPTWNVRGVKISINLMKCVSEHVWDQERFSETSRLSFSPLNINTEISTILIFNIIFRCSHNLSQYIYIVCGGTSTC